MSGQKSHGDKMLPTNAPTPTITAAAAAASLMNSTYQNMAAALTPAAWTRNVPDYNDTVPVSVKTPEAEILDKWAALFGYVSCVKCSSSSSSGATQPVRDDNHGGECNSLSSGDDIDGITSTVDLSVKDNNNNISRVIAMTQLKRFIDKYRVGVPASLSSTSENAIEAAIVQCVVRIVTIVLENMNAATGTLLTATDFSTPTTATSSQQHWTSEDIASMATELAKGRIAARRRAVQVQKTLHDNVSRITEIVCSNLGIDVPSSSSSATQLLRTSMAPLHVLPPPLHLPPVSAAAASTANPCLDAMSLAK